ncbi:MAG: DUF255 domain-containing protein, partial [Lentisphaerae bacterium]|nr:DUF255 domain-containing protein [Lentisphaerota bacterium]
MAKPLWTVRRSALSLGVCLLAAASCLVGQASCAETKGIDNEGKGAVTEQDKKERHTNRLIHETSPYLLQHAHNPVDWYPWGEDALRAAKEQDKPIFLS